MGKAKSQKVKIDLVEIELLKQTVKDLKKLSKPGGISLLIRPVETLAGSLEYIRTSVDLLARYRHDNHVKSLQEKYMYLLSEANAFDQLQPPSFGIDLGENENRNQYIKLTVALSSKILDFARDLESIIAKITKGELTPEKPAEPEQKATSAKRLGIKKGICFSVIFLVLILTVLRLLGWPEPIKAIKGIYSFIIFLAALLTCIYLLWWLWTTFWKK